MAPMTILSGCRKSVTATPSRRNSGFDTTAMSSRCINDCMAALVPTGVVDLLTMMLSAGSRSRTSSMTSEMAEISARPSSPWGVGRQRKTNSLSVTAWRAPRTNLRVCWDSPSCRSSGKRASWIGTWPLFSSSTFVSSMSAQITVWPR